MSNESNLNKSMSDVDISEQYARLLHDMFGPPIESSKPLVYTLHGIEHLHANPTQALELFPDAIGEIEVLLPLPGENIPTYPRLNIVESTQTTHKETSVYVEDAALQLKSHTQSQRDYQGRFRTTDGGLPFPIWPNDPEVSELRKLEVVESTLIMDWLRTVIADPRPRPVSLMHIGLLSDRSEDEVALDALNDAERFELAVASTLDEVRSRSFLKVAHMIPSQDVVELTGIRKISVYDDEVFEISACDSRSIDNFPLVELSGSINNTSYADVALYSGAGKIWMQCGDPPVAPQEYHVAYGGVTLMSGITDGRPGLQPVPLNLLQADGVIEMLETSTLQSCANPGDRPKRWDKRQTPGDDSWKSHE